MGAVSDAEVLAITAKHCTMCHAAKPTHESFKEAPKNVTLESTADLRKYAPLILSQTVQNMAPFIRAFTNVQGSGRWLDSYVAGLLGPYQPSVGGGR